MSKRSVLIVGGYGQVGRAMAARLRQMGCTAVTIGGRRRAPAQGVAEKLGYRWTTIDLNDGRTWSGALEGIDVVVVCMDQDGPAFAEAVLERGLGYIDITASDDLFRQIEALEAFAIASGGWAVLSVGLAPGLTNLMAQACADGMDQVEKIEIGILLGLGDAHGTAALNWTLENLRPYPSSAIRRIAFGSRSVQRASIPFDFADQHVLMRRHGYERVTTRLAFDTPLVTAGGLRLLGHLGRIQGMRGVMRWLFSKFRVGSDRVGLSVTAVGRTQGKPSRRFMSFEARKEAEITALMASQTIVLMLDEPPQTGIHHLEEIRGIDDFADGLRGEGSVLA